MLKESDLYLGIGRRVNIITNNDYITYAPTPKPTNVVNTDHLKIFKDKGFTPAMTLDSLKEKLNEKELLLYKSNEALKIAHKEIHKLYKEIHQLKHPEEEK